MLKALYVRNESCNLLTLKEMTEEFNLSANTIEKLSKQCDAKVKIGRSARYRRDRLQQYIDSLR